MLILWELRPNLDAENASKTLSYLGRALWKFGETAEAKLVLREAAKASVAAASRDVWLPLSGHDSSEPISIARIQSVILDQEGARETLKQVLKLQAPLQYELPRPRPADLRPDSMYFAGPPKLVPAAKRWLDAQYDLVRTLARAGLDDEAFSFLVASKVKQLDVLDCIILGQAQRGSFATAFQTLERLLNDPMTAEAEPSKVIFKPTGEVTFYTQQSPVRPVEILERKAAFKKGLQHISRNAARLGDVHTFKRTKLQLRKEGLDDGFSEQDFQEIRLLAKADQVGAAIEWARAVPNFDGRVSALLNVVFGITGIPSSLDDQSF